jgi:hypothetical protein
VCGKCGEGTMDIYLALKGSCETVIVQTIIVQTIIVQTIIVQGSRSVEV